MTGSAAGAVENCDPRAARNRGRKLRDGVFVTRVGLSIPAAVNYDTWEQAGRHIARVVDSSAWCLGDWIIYGQSRYTDRYRRAVEAAGLDYQTIRNYAWVARRFDLSRRREALSFQHHAEVAALPPGQQDYWLDRAEQHDWSRNELRRNVRGGRQKKTAVSRETGVLPRIAPAAERVERWRIAAERSGSTLEEWICARLDSAASLALTAHHADTGVEV
ncbi:LmbU family transcriptional regulator [Streptomyces sp. CAU 1734]|uniref:LmbU family transcriptional regulator n=1 Tax=Streptomyces sp. CAU 1734 TaxID=3140360 RepID=UPI003261CD90